MVIRKRGRPKGSPNGVATPDLSFMYSVNDLYEMAESYGEQGRSDYVRARFTFDLVWPIVYTFFLVTSISWLFGKATPAEKSIWQRANLVPLLAMVLDYLGEYIDFDRDGALPGADCCCGCICNDLHSGEVDICRS